MSKRFCLLQEKRSSHITYSMILEHVVWKMQQTMRRLVSRVRFAKHTRQAFFWRLSPVNVFLWPGLRVFDLTVDVLKGGGGMFEGRWWNVINYEYPSIPGACHLCSTASCSSAFPATGRRHGVLSRVLCLIGPAALGKGECPTNFETTHTPHTHTHIYIYIYKHINLNLQAVRPLSSVADPAKRTWERARCSEYVPIHVRVQPHFVWLEDAYTAGIESMTRACGRKKKPNQLQTLRAWLWDP